MSEDDTGPQQDDVVPQQGDAAPQQDDAVPQQEAPLEVLLRVQDLDTTITQLEHRRAALPARSRLRTLEGQVASIESQMDAVGAQRQEVVDRLTALDQQVASLTSRRRTLESQLYGARDVAPRDLQAMEGEVHHLTRRRAELEEVELGLMEEQEAFDTQLAALGGQRSELEGQAEALRKELADAEADVNAQLAEVSASRGTEVRRLPTELADRYETIRARLGGVGAARLVGNRCSGCHLELPAMEVDRIRHLPMDTVVTCDQCGRILVRSEEGGGESAGTGNGAGARS